MRHEPPDELLLRRSEPGPRAVLEDWYAERGRRMGIWIAADVDADADADAAAADVDAAADAAAAASTIDGCTAPAAAVADAADVDVADAAAADAADNLKRSEVWLTGDGNMREGLMILLTRGTYYRGLCRMGWLRRIEGDEWEIVGSRVITRTGNIVPLRELAEGEGKLSGHKLGKPAKTPESVHRLHMVRNIDVPREDWEKWAKDFPMPEGWETK